MSDDDKYEEQSRWEGDQEWGQRREVGALKSMVRKRLTDELPFLHRLEGSSQCLRSNSKHTTGFVFCGCGNGGLERLNIFNKITYYFEVD